MRLIVQLTMCLGACASLCSAQDRIDLPRAIELALKQNKTLAQSVLQTRMAVLGVAGAKAPFALMIRPDGTAAGLGNDREEAGAGIAATKKLRWGTEVRLASNLKKTTYATGAEDSSLYEGSVSVELNQPLLRGFGELVNTEEIALARSKVAESRRLVEMQKADLVVETVRTYVELLRLKRQKEAAGESAIRMERLSRLTKAMERRGGATRIDTLRSELQLGQARAQVESYGQDYDSTMRDFAELLGEEPGKTLELEPVPFVEENLPEPESVEEIAVRNRLDYAQSLQDLHDAERGGLVAKKRMLPDLSLTLHYQRFGSGENASEATRLGEELWFVGLTSSTDLLRTEDRIAYRQALVNSEVAAGNLKIMETGIRKQAQQYLLAYKRGIRESDIARANFELAQARAVLSRKLFELGKADNFSVTDAEMAYMSAETQLLETVTDTILAGYRLRRALGTLLEAPADLLPPKENGRKGVSEG